MSRKNSGLYKEKTEDLNNDKDSAAGAAGAGREDFEELTAGSPAAAPHTGEGDRCSYIEASRPRGWAYEPAAIAENLLLPFETSEFRAAWVAYRTYREEQKLPRLAGGMQEQEVLRKLGVLAAGDEQRALAIISQAIEKGWKNLYKLDESNATARPSFSKRPAAGAGRVETLPTYGRNRGPQASPASGAA